VVQKSDGEAVGGLIPRSPDPLDQGRSVRSQLGVATSKSEPELAAERSWRLGLDPLLLTDHDTTGAAFRLEVVSRQRVVVGQEINTTDGDLIGLFLQQRIPPGLAARQPALEIKIRLASSISSIDMVDLGGT
jgi:hypothetical protein